MFKKPDSGLAAVPSRFLYSRIATKKEKSGEKGAWPLTVFQECYSTFNKDLLDVENVFIAWSNLLIN